jgi:hypothetical protein
MECNPTLLVIHNQLADTKCHNCDREWQVYMNRTRKLQNPVLEKMPLVLSPVTSFGKWKDSPYVHLKDTRYSPLAWMSMGMTIDGKRQFFNHEK